MFVLLALLQVASPAAAPRASADTLPVITLSEARRRAIDVAPEHVAAAADVDAAGWDRRAALSAIVLPDVTLSSDATRFSTESFNIGTGRPQLTSVTARLDASYDLFTGGRKWNELRRARASLESARANEVLARFQVELGADEDYFAALAGEELVSVAEERVRRADEELTVARARVLSGAAVQSDSLQVRLELLRARVDLLRQQSALRVARLQLGRRVGADGAIRAAPVDTAALPPLPIALDAAVVEALSRGPAYDAARADEAAAAATVSARRGSYFPQLTLGATAFAFDDQFFPTATTRQALTITATLPVWNGGQRELAVAEARAVHERTRAVRRDLERAARRDVTEAYEGYETARAAHDLAAQGLAVARENFRVQDARYRAGAASVLDLLDAQLALTQSEADLVQSRLDVRTALARLEAILGRHLFSTEAL
ncbi:MAG TPA: TolC family protein [Gemmatimonadaceae bacterium]|nr:TolC family protein [Gemmatimonadaceae bacterium]